MNAATRSRGEPEADDRAGPKGVFSGEPEPVDPADLAHASTCLRLARRSRVSSRSLHDAMASENFGELARSTNETAPDLRQEWPWQFLGYLKGRDEALAGLLGRALDAAAPMVAAEPDEPEGTRAEAAGSFSLDLVGSAAFFAETYSLEWHARGCMVRGESCVVGGPSKSLKTSVLIDKAVSLASATPFLGRFPVEKPTRVGLISGESGRRVIQANAKQICLTRGIPYEDVAGIYWGFKLPQLTNAEHLGTLRKAIGDHGLEVMCLDPLYLSLLAGASGIDAGNMYQMGPLLNDVASTCLEAGATPSLCHHAVKRRENPFEPMELEDLAFSGIGQFARQWMLLSRRERYDAESGLHRLHFRYGGSAGHAGELHLDIETGRVDEDFNGRLWNVTTSSPSHFLAEKQARAAAEQQGKKEEQRREADARKAVGIAADADRCLEAIRDLTRQTPAVTPTPRAIRTRAKLSGEQAAFALDHLLVAGRVEKYEARVKAGTGERPSDAYREPLGELHQGGLLP